MLDDLGEAIFQRHAVLGAYSMPMGELPKNEAGKYQEFTRWLLKILISY